jgi:hypothetical protein
MRIPDPPQGLQEVRFYIDGEEVALDTEEPFQYKFHTSDFIPGERVMHAVGLLSSGESIESNRITKVFLTSDQAWSETQAIIVPLLVGVAALTLLGVGVPVLFGRDKEFVLGKYGPAGGVVCPRCQLPFSRSLWSPNLVIGKLVRCPHCGKISIMGRASQQNIQRAEERYLKIDQPKSIRSDQEDLRKQLEDSRFED